MKFMNNHYGQQNIFGRARCKMPMNLQFFAESAGDGGGIGEHSGGVEGANEGNNSNYESIIEEMQNRLAEAESRVAKVEDERNKLKASLDKQLKKSGELEKQRRAGMSETQLEIQSLKDQNEEIVNQNKELVEQNKKLVENDRISRYTKSFMACSMDEKTADLFAQSIGELKDEPKFFSAFKKYAENLAKSSGENAVQELIKNNPDINAGSGGDTKNSLAEERAVSIGKRTAGANEDILKFYRR